MVTGNNIINNISNYNKWKFGALTQLASISGKVPLLLYSSA